MAEIANSANDHFQHSTLRENILEHIFLGALLKHLWRVGHRDIDVLKAEVDASGFDLAIECRGVLRHIQLKASHQLSKTSRVPINNALSKKPSGCVIWIRFDESTLQLKSFGWLGGKAGSPLPDLGARIGSHTRGDKKFREKIRVVSSAAFRKLNSMEEVARELFG